MIQNQPCVNGIIAAVLSASITPLHGALAREKSPRLQKISSKQRAPKMDATLVAMVAKPAAPKAGFVQ
jgi:hypothetical protein